MSNFCKQCAQIVRQCFKPSQGLSTDYMFPSSSCFTWCLRIFDQKNALARAELLNSATKSQRWNVDRWVASRVPQKTHAPSKTCSSVKNYESVCFGATSRFYVKCPPFLRQNCTERLVVHAQKRLSEFNFSMKLSHSLGQICVSTWGVPKFCFDITCICGTLGQAARLPASHSTKEKKPDRSHEPKCRHVADTYMQ